jgi:hypothetical protein
MPIRFDKPPIYWHNDLRNAVPLTSLDSHPSGRFATVGQDTSICLWKLRHNPAYKAEASQISFFESEINQTKQELLLLQQKQKNLQLQQSLSSSLTQDKIDNINLLLSKNEQQLLQYETK